MCRTKIQYNLQSYAADKWLQSEKIFDCMKVTMFCLVGIDPKIVISDVNVTKSKCVVHTITNFIVEFFV